MRQLKLKQQRITIGSRVRMRRAGMFLNALHGTVRGAAYMKDSSRYIRVEWDHGNETIVRERELVAVRKYIKRRARRIAKAKAAGTQ